MKTKLLFVSFIVFAITISIFSCKKEDNPTLPTITTDEITNITDTSATSGGKITSTGGAAIKLKGICIGLMENPTINDSLPTDKTASDNFVINLKSLKGGVTYHVRAFATNSVGVGYGQSISFSTIVKNQTITLGPGYTNDVYYSLKNGVVATAPRTNWDIAFSVSTRSSSIIINEANGTGTILKLYPKTWTWAGAIDTTGYSTWPRLANSNTDWEVGAFNANATGHPNYGWGIYNAVNHNIENAEGGTLYIIKLGNGTFKKVWIETKFSSLQKYSFRYANIDGTSPQIVSNMSLAGSKANYGYYSLQNNQLIANREPDATTWDLLFTKWEDIVSSQPYIVTGVLQNIGVKAIDLTVSDPANITYTDNQFSLDINTIGYDWKSFNGASYDVATNRVFVVKNVAGKVYKIIFTSFAGSSTGVLAFTIKEL